MLGQLMNSPFVVGACYFVLILVFVLSALFDTRGRRENQFPDSSSAFDDPELELQLVYEEDDDPKTVPVRLAELSDPASNGTGRPGSGFAV